MTDFSKIIAAFKHLLVYVVLLAVVAGLGYAFAVWGYPQISGLLVFALGVYLVWSWVKIASASSKKSSDPSGANDSQSRQK
jgi:threonine/homoserine/homoserine lactone efflux protein